MECGCHREWMEETKDICLEFLGVLDIGRVGRSSKKRSVKSGGEDESLSFVYLKFIGGVCIWFLVKKIRFVADVWWFVVWFCSDLFEFFPFGFLWGVALGDFSTVRFGWYLDLTGTLRSPSILSIVFGSSAHVKHCLRFIQISHTSRFKPKTFNVEQYIDKSWKIHRN